MYKHLCNPFGFNFIYFRIFKNMLQSAKQVKTFKILKTYQLKILCYTIFFKTLKLNKRIATIILQVPTFIYVHT